VNWYPKFTFLREGINIWLYKYKEHILWTWLAVSGPENSFPHAVKYPGRRPGEEEGGECISGDLTLSFPPEWGHLGLNQTSVTASGTQVPMSHPWDSISGTESRFHVMFEETNLWDFLPTKTGSLDFWVLYSAYVGNTGADKWLLGGAKVLIFIARKCRHLRSDGRCLGEMCKGNH
jgi:hypothetical protein